MRQKWDVLDTTLFYSSYYKEVNSKSLGQAVPKINRPCQGGTLALTSIRAFGIARA